MKVPIAFEKVRDVKTPAYGTEGSAALDFYVPNDKVWQSITLAHGEGLLIPSGIKVQLPPNMCLLALNKSGLGSKGLNVGACLIDSDYRGEIHLSVFNQSKDSVLIRRGEKLIQFILTEYYKAELYESIIENNTARGQGGFGSTGAH